MIQITYTRGVKFCTTWGPAVSLIAIFTALFGQMLTHYYGGPAELVGLVPKALLGAATVWLWWGGAKAFGFWPFTQQLILFVGFTLAMLFFFGCI